MSRQKINIEVSLNFQFYRYLKILQFQARMTVDCNMSPSTYDCRLKNYTKSSFALYRDRSRTRWSWKRYHTSAPESTKRVRLPGSYAVLIHLVRTGKVLQKMGSKTRPNLSRKWRSLRNTLLFYMELFRLFHNRNIANTIIFIMVKAGCRITVI